jgi:hypothetical protein
LRTIKPLAPSLSYYILRSVYEPGYAPPAFWLGLILLGVFLGPIVLGLMFKSIMERGKKKSILWIAWVVLYLVGMAAIVGISSLDTYYSGSPAWLLAVYPALVLPLFFVLFFGERFKTRPAAGKYTVPATAFGMALAQVLVFFFVPNSLVAIPVGVVCFPVLGIAGLIIIPAVILQGLKRRPQQA